MRHDPAVTFARLKRAHAEMMALGAQGIFREWVRDLFLSTGGTVAEADRVVDRVIERRRHLRDPEKWRAAAVERAAYLAEQSTGAVLEDFLRRRRKNRPPAPKVGN